MRLSAMGDVAMLLPILYAVARANPEHEFTLLTQPFFANLLLSPPPNVEAMVIDPKGEEKSFLGLCNYADRLLSERFDLCLDMHDVLRTKFFRFILWISGGKTWHIQKPRQERKRLLATNATRDLSPIRSMHQLYTELFQKAGLREAKSIDPISLEEGFISPITRELFPESLDDKAIGFAPFASTDSKTYDINLSEILVRLLSDQGFTIYLFGGRDSETQILEQWSQKYPRVVSLAGKLDLPEELFIISKLSMMISMDSANMHFASMLGRPVLSIWCSTHPSAGFLGLGQELSMCLQDHQLSCRPCSIFGQVKHCKQGDMPCRRSLAPRDILQKVLEFREQKTNTTKEHSHENQNK